MVLLNFNKIYAAISILLLCIFFQINAVFGQTKILNVFELSLAPTVYQPLKVTNIEGIYDLNSAQTISGKAFLSYSYFLQNDFFIKLGFGATIVPHQVNFEHKDSMDNGFRNALIEDAYINNYQPNFNADGLFEIYHYGKEYDQVAYIINFSVGKHFELNEKLKFKIEFGLDELLYERNNLTSGLSYNIAEPNKIFQYELNSTISAEKNAQLFNSFKIGIGLVSVNKKVLFGIDMFYNFVPSITSTGNYYFINHQNNGYGTIEQRINNFGLSFNFGIATEKQL